MSRRSVVTTLLTGHVRSRRNDELLDLAAQQAGGADRDLRVLNATLAARRAVTVLGYWGPREFSRVRWRLSGARSAAVPYQLSLLCPSRQRVDRALTYLRSIQRTAALPERIEVLFYVDDDDPELVGYQGAFGTEDGVGGSWNRPDRVRTRLFVRPRMPLPKAWNILAAAAVGDFLLMGNDDQLYVSFGWDHALDVDARRLADTWPDGIWCGFFDGGQYEDRGADFPIVTRAWYETLGYFTWPDFENWETERWVFDLGHRAGRIHTVHGPLVRHLHFQDYQAPFDETYQAHRLTRDKSRRDRELFHRTSHLRAQEVLTLTEAIAHHTSTAPAGSTPAAEPDKLTESNRDRARAEVGRSLGALTELGAHSTARSIAEVAVGQGLWDNPMQRPVQYLPGLPAKPVHDPSELWFVAHLERRFSRIRAELDAVLAAGDTGFATVDENLLTDGRWDQVVLFEGGQRFEPACERFPVIAQAMSAIPEATTQGPGVVSLSWLYPGTHIKPHCGRSNAYLRVHLGLKVPGKARMRVGHQELEWQEGQCLVFDDSFEHEVWHDGDEPRIVLLFDVWNPALADSKREVLARLRPSTQDKIKSFMIERDLTRIENRDSELALLPGDRLESLIRRYMEQTDARSVELRDGELHFVQNG